MTVALGDLDAHEQPSDKMRAEWKMFSKMDATELLKDSRIDDPRLPTSQNGFRKTGQIPKEQISQAFEHLGLKEQANVVKDDALIIHHPLLPGTCTYDLDQHHEVLTPL